MIAPNWVGDVVMALPVLESLAEQRTLIVLAKPHLKPLLEMSPGVDGVLERRRSNREMIDRIKDLEVDEAFVLPNSFRSAWIPYRAGVPMRWGYRGDLRSPLLEPAVARPTEGRRHQVRDYDRLLQAMGLRPPGRRQPRLVPSEVMVAKAQAELENLGMSDSPEPILGLFAGAAFGASKRWPEDRFASLGVRLAEEGSRPLLIAGPGEEDLAQRVAEATSAHGGVRLPVAGPDMDLAELAALLARLDLLVTNDSGPMHLAAAVGTRCVAIFGPTDPRRTSPLGEDHHVLWTQRWCSPCFRKRCPLLHHKCLKEIPVDRVLAACRAALGEAR